MGKKRKKVDKSARPKVKAKTKKALAAAKAKSQEVLAPPAEQLSDRAAPATTVDLWFDPVCPWTWLASRWLLDVETVRSVKTGFHVMSRSLLGGGTSEPRGPARVALTVGEQYGQEQLSAFYTAIGTRIHESQQGTGTDTVAGALADVGLPPELAELAETDDNDDALRASHHAGVDPVGDDVDTPVIQINGTPFVGPVFSPRPTGEDAGRVFDGALALTCYPGFFELRRTRPASPDFG
jgi:hypothetical protein